MVLSRQTGRHAGPQIHKEETLYAHIPFAARAGHASGADAAGCRTPDRPGRGRPEPVRGADGGARQPGKDRIRAHRRGNPPQRHRPGGGHPADPGQGVFPRLCRQHRSRRGQGHCHRYRHRRLHRHRGGRLHHHREGNRAGSHRSGRIPCQAGQNRVYL